MSRPLDGETVPAVPLPAREQLAPNVKGVALHDIAPQINSEFHKIDSLNIRFATIQ
jgi:hypothetical protein